MTRSSKRNRRRLPRAPTGCRNGQCFIAALLAHVGENDLERSAVPDRAIEKVRQQLREGKRRSEYLGGEEQGDVAVALGLSYITVERGSRTANVYKYGCGAVEEQQYAMLVQDKPRHTEPLPTEGVKESAGLFATLAHSSCSRSGALSSTKGGASAATSRAPTATVPMPE